MQEKEEREAVFWASLLHPVIFKEVEPDAINSYLKKLASQERLLPNGDKSKVSLSTLRRKLNQYNKAGLQSIARKKRSDKGKARSIKPEIVAKAIELKKEQPLRSDRSINQMLNTFYGTAIARSTLYRHLKKAGATKIKLNVSKKKVRGRWTKDNTHDLWVGDFEDGPYVRQDGKNIPTFQSAFIDVHSRFVVVGRYYIKETFDTLIDSLLRAWTTHGKSKAIFLDNAKIYRSPRLKTACYGLHINLKHRPVREPESGGIVERYFQTCQTNFEPEVRAGNILTLEELNSKHSAWLHASYHTSTHSEIGMSPKAKYDAGKMPTRHVDLEAAKFYFLKKEVRIVNATFSDIRLDSRFYKAPLTLRGDKVIVRYDPYSDLKTVLLYQYDEPDKYLGNGEVYNREVDPEANDHINAHPAPTEIKNDYLAMLEEKHKRQLDEESRGIDYKKIMDANRNSVNKFIAKVANLLGRKGGVSGFTAGELEDLDKTYKSVGDIDCAAVVTAYKKTSSKDLHNIIATLKKDGATFTKNNGEN